jgi:hypothetical protein
MVEILSQTRKSWLVARHVTQLIFGVTKNYVADWTMSFLWGAVVGTATPIPYFYSVFFITVLIHRCGRDFER